MNAPVRALQEQGQPVVSMETKHKELGGDLFHQGQAWQPTGLPEEVQTPAVPAPSLGTALPSGVYARRLSIKNT
jgi:hypothetical protein